MFISFKALMIGKWYWWMIRFFAANLPSMDDGDRMRQKLTKNGNFNIRSFYHKLRGSSSIVFPQKGIWKVKALWCVSFFVWTVAQDRILTSDNLQRRGFDFINWCTMCRCCREIVDHLLLHCEKAHRLWSCLQNFWDFVGSLKIGCKFNFWLVELVGEAFI